MNKTTKFSILSLATAMFAGVLVNASPFKNVEAYDDFIVEFHRKKFLEFEAGDHFTVALTTENEVFTMGINNHGQLGIGSTTPYSKNVPTNITSSFNLNANEIIIDIDAGANHIVAATNQNRIFAWGLNDYAQTGSGTTTNLLSPTDVTANWNPSSAKTVKQIVAAQFNTLVLFTDNTLRIAGANGTGMLLQGTSNFAPNTNVVTPNISSFLSTDTIESVGMYDQHGYILTNTGKIGTWGNNLAGQLGDNTLISKGSLVTVTLSGLISGEKAISVAAGKEHTVVVTNKQKIFFWGTNTNYAIGDAVALNTVQKTPLNVSSFFNTPQGNYSNSFFIGPSASNDWGYRAIGVYAGQYSTFFKLMYINVDNSVVTEYPEDIWFASLGLNKNDAIYAIISSDTNDQFIREPYWLSIQSWNENAIDKVSFSKTNHYSLNSEGDVTMYGANVHGQMGLGYATTDTEEYNYNWSYNFRYFEEYIYANLPVLANLTLPLDNYFTWNNMPQSRVDEYNAIFGYWANENYFEHGIVGYYFSDILTEKESLLYTEDQLSLMREIFAIVFEDEILHGYIPATNEAFLAQLLLEEGNHSGWRYDLEYYANYGSWNMSWDDELYLDDAVITLLSPEVEARLDEFRLILANLETFEQTFLQSFIDAVIALEIAHPDLYDFTYTDDDGNVWLDLYDDAIFTLIELGYGDDILGVFTAFNQLSELEQLLLTSYYDENYWHLYYTYYEAFANAYEEQLYTFENDVQDGDWSWYWPLFQNLEALQTLLSDINQLNPISYDIFIATWTDQWGDEYYDYEIYEYWIWLNDLLPYLLEGKEVFDQIVLIEGLIQEEDGYYWVDVEDAAGIIAMYNAFLALSEDAQYLLDPEYIGWLYSLALEALAYDVQDQLWNLWNIEDENGTYGLFANYDDVLSALAAFEALPEDALEYMDEEAIEYYQYLLSIKLALEEGMSVYQQIMDIEAMLDENEDLNEETIAAIAAMYTDYLALSEEAKSLLDPAYVDWLTSLAVQAVENQINQLPGSLEDFDAAFNNADTKAQTIANLLNAWNQYQAMSNDLQDLMDPEARAHLEALYARYLELTRPQVDLLMIGLVLIHLSAGAYFAFKKRDVLVKAVEN